MTTPEQVGTDVDVIEVRTPADVAYVSTLRLTAASLASRCDLTIDDIEDLRLAVDEACALLLPHATVSSPLDARFEVGAGELRVHTSVATSGPADPDRDGFAWTVLGALATAVDVDAGADRLTITVAKKREPQ
ncbi:serine/threonine-protein kinase RsbW [Jatrophihabitans endophyticus]|uniref:Serine/threonine-protein kinase RsbW n=1 Tax=Jatrophihabitans endophyticus TaxID=1206085 RepID=A0A1M5E884_9ACTN|nr:ATP-binding protein [Jatrophihabitans endophyticus]SHF75427.1 serine/threonine-protein kinase RsbW [Jatrophihabitans endophyticus]